MKNYIGISRDHSGSMRNIARAAAKDYNSNIAAIQENSLAEKQDTIVSVVKCGVGYNGTIETEVVNSTVSKLKPLNENHYSTDGGSTPLFSSVFKLIDILENVPDAKDPTVSFLIMAVTDGQDNASGKDAGTRLGRKIQELQGTDHWTFVFRVPHGYKHQLVQLGIPDGNILEWEQTTQGVEIASKATSEAFRGFYASRSAGATSTKGFYNTDLTGVSARTVASKLVEITNDVKFYDVTSKDAGSQIKSFIELKTGKAMGIGSAFYQLMKTEREVQDYKQIALRNKKDHKVFSGAEARKMLGLPYNGTVKIVPGNHGQYDIFIQSTSVNRKLVEGTQVMHWENVGVTT